MPILSYLVLPEAGAKEQLCTDLSTMEGCEIIPSDNEEVVVQIGRASCRERGSSPV